MNDPHFEESWAIYNESFPIEERRDLAQQVAALTMPNYISLAVVDEGRTLGVICYWLFGEDLIFVEHIAISRSARGGGIGAIVMEYVKSLGREVVLEIEPVVDDITRRRRGFYERLGFCTTPHEHRQPPFRSGDGWLPLVVMSYPESISRERYELFRDSQIEVVKL